MQYERNSVPIPGPAVILMRMSPAKLTFFAGQFGATFVGYPASRSAGVKFDMKPFTP